MTNLEQKLQTTLQKTVDNKTIFGVTFQVEKGDGSFTFAGSAGNLQNDSQYFIASTTKLYTTAIILKLAAQNALQLDAPITQYLPGEITHGLLIRKGTDYGPQLTTRQLLSHTSGLPDYFQQKKASGKSLLEEITSGIDQAWSFEQAIAEAKKMPPAFLPGEKGKALYSDTNYQLLGRIIETVSGLSYASALEQWIFSPLGLQKTYLYANQADTRPAPLYYKNKPLPIPLAMISFGSDGGIVSTAAESMTFLKAFFRGQFFPAAYFNEMKRWNRIFFPLEYGMGLSRFALPRIFSPFQPLPDFLGHSGLSGAVAFYAPAKDLFITGTVNQVAAPDRSFRLMLELAANL